MICDTSLIVSHSWPQIMIVAAVVFWGAFSTGCTITLLALTIYRGQK